MTSKKLGILKIQWRIVTNHCSGQFQVGATLKQGGVSKMPGQCGRSFPLLGQLVNQNSLLDGRSMDFSHLLVGPCRLLSSAVSGAVCSRRTPAVFLCVPVHKEDRLKWLEQVFAINNSMLWI